MYNEIKTELSRRCSSIRYFSRAWMELYERAVQKYEHFQKSGINQWYRDSNGILLNHAFDPVYESDFYRKNSPAYCEFLTIRYETLH